MHTRQTIALKVVGVLTSGMLIIPFSALAADGVVNRAKATDKSFCAKIETVEGKILTRSQHGEQQLLQSRLERERKLHVRRAERDSKVFEKRNGRDTQLEGLISRLEKHAVTDGQKNAVSAFRVAIQNALDTRRNSVDSALEKYRLTLDGVIDNRKNLSDVTLIKFREALDAALLKSKTDCAAGLDPEVAKKAYNDAIKSAKDSFDEERRAVLTVSESIKPAILARKEAINSARDNFRAEVEKAKSDLKLIFGDARVR